jgi:protein-L-isoaspartate(D-aspartate) O-methyltransferase
MSAHAAPTDRADDAERRAAAALVGEIAAMARRCGAETGRPELQPRVLAALAAVPRHRFVPPALLTLAYANAALPIGHDQTISQPFIVALMTDLADLAPDDAVLEIGTGSGYQAAILARLAARVDSVEIVADLAATARDRLAALGAEVHVHLGDGWLGHAAGAPYDAILVTAAAPAIPAALLAQLRVGGRLVMPLGPLAGGQRLIRAVKGADGTVASRACLDVRFVPMAGVEACAMA